MNEAEVNLGREQRRSEQKFKLSLQFGGLSLRLCAPSEPLLARLVVVLVVLLRLVCPFEAFRSERAFELRH